MKVLVVDDVGLIRHRICRTLSELGIDAVSARSGSEALAAIRADHSIDTVVTDLMMPGMSGIELFRTSQLIERCDDQGTVPPPGFVLLTAIRPSEGGWANADLKTATEIGFAAILHKPILKSELEQALNSLQQKRASERSGKSDHFASLLLRIEQAGNEIRASGNPQWIEQLGKLLQTQLAASATLAGATTA